MKPGDQYRFTGTAYSLAGVGYNRGDIITLMEPTGQDPWNTGSKDNWMVLCKHWHPPQPESIWTSIPMMLEFKVIEKVE